MTGNREKVGFLDLVILSLLENVSSYLHQDSTDDKKEKTDLFGFNLKSQKYFLPRNGHQQNYNLGLPLQWRGHRLMVGNRREYKQSTQYKKKKRISN